MPAAHDEDVEPRGAELVAEDGRALLLRSATLRVEAQGGLARAVLEQEFENASDEALRVTYKMPLPADGAVSGYAFTIGARTIKGRVDPRAVARERFEGALASGKTAAILEQERQDIFTQEIGNIPPRQAIVARVTVDMRLAWLHEGEWEMRFPTVIGPRYVGSGDTAEDASAVALEVAEGIRSRFHLEVRVGDEVISGRRVESPSHAIREREPGIYELAVAAGERLDRDVVVRWAVAKPAVGVSLASGAQKGRHFGLITIVPPSRDARASQALGSPSASSQPLSRVVIVLLDTSGSMGGAPLDNAKNVVAALVGSLCDSDRLELVEFSNAPRRWRAEPVSATERSKKEALAWLRGLSAGGGTEMHTAVMAALASLRPGAQRQVVLVTDGYIGGEERIIRLLAEQVPEGCRMHFVGVGAAPNRSLATSMARAGRGAEILVGFGEDPERGARRLLARTCEPVLTDVTIEGDALVDRASRFVPDVFAGSPVLAGVELSEAGGEILVRGKVAGGTWQQRVRVPRAPAGEDGAIAALFARERALDLEIESAIGLDRDRELERLGVEFQITTRMTSWVAVDDVASVDPYAPSRHEAIPQELPYGTTFASFGPPAGCGPTLFGGLASPRMSGPVARSVAPAFEMGRALPSHPLGFGAPPPASMQVSREAAPAPLSAPKRRRSGLALLLFVLLLFAAALLWFFFTR